MGATKINNQVKILSLAAELLAEGGTIAIVM
jgi:hypothetical protein